MLIQCIFKKCPKTLVKKLVLLHFRAFFLLKEFCIPHFFFLYSIEIPITFIKFYFYIHPQNSAGKRKIAKSRNPFFDAKGTKNECFAPNSMNSLRIHPFGESGCLVSLLVCFYECKKFFLRMQHHFLLNAKIAPPECKNPVYKRFSGHFHEKIYYK